MSRTVKDSPKMRRERWWTRQPSWFNRASRRRHRTRASQDIRNGREPLPRYKDDREWYW